MIRIGIYGYGNLGRGVEEAAARSVVSIRTAMAAAAILRDCPRRSAALYFPPSSR